MDEKAKKAAIAKVYKLKAEHEQVARLLEGQKRRVAKLDHELAVTNAAVAEEERIRTGAAASGGGGHNAWKRTLGKANGTIAILETRLLRANERRNRAEDHNLGLRHVIDEERRHRMNLDATCERFKNEMRHLDGNIQHGMMEASRLAEENACVSPKSFCFLPPRSHHLPPLSTATSPRAWQSSSTRTRSRASGAWRRATS